MPQPRRGPGPTAGAQSGHPRTDGSPRVRQSPTTSRTRTAGPGACCAPQAAEELPAGLLAPEVLDDDADEDDVEADDDVDEEEPESELPDDDPPSLFVDEDFAGLLLDDALRLSVR